MPGQTKLASLTEVSVMVATGYVWSFMMQTLVLPIFGIETTAQQRAGMAAIIVTAAFIRLYAVRRFFNWWHTRPSI